MQTVGRLQVAFIQILKVATPAFTLTICMLLGLERPSWALGASVLMIVLGTGLATVIESGGSGFSWLGFAYFTISAFLEAIRVVYIQLLLGALKYNAVEVLVWLGEPPVSLLHLCLACVPLCPCALKHSYTASNLDASWFRAFPQETAPRLCLKPCCPAAD